MRNRLKYIPNLILILILTSCEYWDSGHDIIAFINDSDIALDITSQLDYPDLDIGEKSILAFPEWSRRVAPRSGNTEALKYQSPNWEIRFRDDIRSGVLVIQILDSKIVDSLDWDTIRSGNMVLQQYFVTLNDLERLNWILYYPPREIMKNIKMSPPYKEAKKIAK